MNEPLLHPIGSRSTGSSEAGGQCRVIGAGTCSLARSRDGGCRHRPHDSRPRLVACQVKECAVASSRWYARETHMASPGQGAKQCPILSLLEQGLPAHEGIDGVADA
jgi:hypothetical protein